MFAWEVLFLYEHPLKPANTTKIVFFLSCLQISELEAEFENLPPGRPQQTRFLRSQQDLKAKLEEQAAKGDDAGEGKSLHVHCCHKSADLSCKHGPRNRQ